MSVRSHPPAPKEEHSTRPSDPSRLHRVLAAGLATSTTSTTSTTSVKRQTREETDVDGDVPMEQDARDTLPKRSKPLPPPPASFLALPTELQQEIFLSIESSDDPCKTIGKYCQLNRQFAAICRNDEEFWYWLCRVNKFDSNAAIRSEWHQDEAADKSQWDTWRGWFQYCCPLRLTNKRLQVELADRQENSHWEIPYGPISTWDTSRVTDMSYLLSNNPYFNDDIGNWDVSNVRKMRHMFSQAEDFNQDISRWDVSNVTDMEWMFEEAASFNQDISRWNVSNVTDMSYMFAFASSFNQDISSWDVSNVKEASWMFADATSFNQDLRGWKLCKLTFPPQAQKTMFENATSFDRRYMPTSLVDESRKGCED